APFNVVANRSIAPSQSHIPAPALARVEESSVVRPLIGITVLFARLPANQENEGGLGWRANSALSLTTKLLVQFSSPIHLSGNKGYVFASVHTNVLRKYQWSILGIGCVKRNEAVGTVGYLIEQTADVPPLPGFSAIQRDCETLRQKGVYRRSHKSLELNPCGRTIWTGKSIWFCPQVFLDSFAGAPTQTCRMEGEARPETQQQAQLAVNSDVQARINTALRIITNDDLDEPLEIGFPLVARMIKVSNDVVAMIGILTGMRVKDDLIWCISEGQLPIQKLSE